MSNDFETELKSGFLEEASQLLMNAEQCFLTLEQNPQDTATLENIFRIAHNIKGSARAVGFDALGAFTHEFESFLIQCKTGKIPLTPRTISLLLKCNDHVNQWIETLKADHQASLSNDALIQEILSFSSETPEAAASPSAPAPASPSLSAPSPAALAANSADAEAPADSAVAPPPEPLSIPTTKAATKPATGVDESIRVSLARLEKLLNYVGEMVILQTVLREQSFADNPALLRRTINQMGKVTKEVQDISMSLRMVPVKQTFQKMQRIVRDTSAALGKKVNLILQGEETEVDKTILENLSDPLVHLIRNAVDHGIEVPEKRAAAGKGETGEIILRASHQSGNLVIEIRDNGAGIDARKLKEKAREKGIAGISDTMPDRDAYNLIFHSGFSTKEVVTDVSGRGVGMDVVKTNIEQLQGEIQIETALGQGTTFRIRLPLTLAIIDGMIIRCQNERYVVPLAHVHESLRPDPKDIHWISGIGEVLSLRGEQIPLYRLGGILSPSQPPTDVQKSTVVVIRIDERPFSVLVDDILGQHQVVIKQLGEEHRHLRGISGSAILGDGRPALILELTDLIKRAASAVSRPNPTPRRATA